MSLMALRARPPLGGVVDRERRHGGGHRTTPERDVEAPPLSPDEDDSGSITRLVDDVLPQWGRQAATDPRQPRLPGLEELLAGLRPAEEVAHLQADDFTGQALAFIDADSQLHPEVFTAVAATPPIADSAARRQAAAWRIEIRGRPNVKANIALEDPDPTAPHMRAAVDATVAIALHAIPAVCAAPAGFHAVPAALQLQRGGG